MAFSRKNRKLKEYTDCETQFHNIFETANRQKGITGGNLIKLLERRLDNVVYRLGFAPSRKSARQLVLHGHFWINGKTVDIPSYTLAPGDVISLRERSKKWMLFTILTKNKRQRLQLVVNR